MKKIIIPAGRLADDEMLKRKREELKRKLMEGKKVTISPTGNVTGPDDGTGISIPKGKLAGEPDDAALKRMRQDLKQRLLAGKKVEISPTGDVTGKTGGSTISIPKGKLAVQQWYERDPSLLAAEKAAMQHAFPHFQLDKLDDGRLCWIGELGLGVMGNNKWTVMAVYNNNHPQQVMGSSVRVYLVEPDIDELIEGLGVKPFHLLLDDNNQYYLCTAQADDIKTGGEVTSAASVMAWAVKWLAAFELTLTGELSWEEFNTHGVI